MAPYADDLTLAHILADAADTVSVARFRTLDLRVSTKPDLTPVTDADTAIERNLRELLGQERPQDRIIGEEFGDHPPAGPDSGRRWIIDPIDGTKNFIRGVPIWATLIALMDGDRPVIGLVSAPALRRRWWAVAGGGASVRGGGQEVSPLRVSSVSSLADASLSYASLGGWESIGRLDAMLQLMRDTWRQRAYGDFFGYMLVAEGSVDICVEPQLSVWDLAALIPIVTEAGGTFTGLDGRRTPYAGSAVATNGLLHSAILDRLGPDDSTPGTSIIC